MTVKIRLSATDGAELDSAVAAIAGVLDVPAGASQDYRSRRPGDATLRRYLDAEVTSQDRGQLAGRRAQQPPRAAMEDAKRRRDIAGEVGVAMNAHADLTAQPWYPLQPGDVVLVHLDTYGETYVAGREVDTLADGAQLLRVAATDPAMSDDEYPVSLLDLWFEAGPAALTIIRAGAVVFGRPTERKG